MIFFLRFLTTELIAPPSVCLACPAGHLHPSQGDVIFTSCLNGDLREGSKPAVAGRLLAQLYQFRRHSASAAGGGGQGTGVGSQGTGAGSTEQDRQDMQDEKALSADYPAYTLFILPILFPLPDP